MWEKYSCPVLNCEPSHLSGGTWESCETNRVVTKWDVNIAYQMIMNQSHRHYSCGERMSGN